MRLMRAINSIFAILCICANQTGALETAESVSIDSPLTLADIELQYLRQKRDLLSQKLELYEQRRKELTIDLDDSIKDGIKSLVNATQKSFVKEHEFAQKNYEKVI